MILACALLMCPTRAIGQQPTVPYDGAEIFCHLLKHFKIQPIGSIDALANHRADETIIVVFKDLRPLHTISRNTPDLDAYALLLASDRDSRRAMPVPGQPNQFREIDLLGPWRLRIPGFEVNQPNRTAFQKRPSCPVIKQGLDRNHPVFRGLTQGIATNAPSVLRSTDSDLDIVARFEEDCYVLNGENWQDKWLESDFVGYAFATPGRSPQRTLILGGHGVFMNSMLAQFDNDNFLFAVNAIRWLREGPDGQRKYALMIHDGKVMESFDLPLTAPPNVPMPPVHVINQMLRELENEGVFQRFLEETVGRTTILRFAILMGTLGLLVYGFYRLFLMRHQHEAVPLVVGLTPLPASSRSVLQQRQFELLALDNLWEPAQALARQWFLEHARVEAPLWDEADQRPPPNPTYRAGWWARRQLSQQLRAAWSLAIRDPSQRVRMREFRRLTDVLGSLTRAVKEGQLVFRDGEPAKG